MVSDGAQQFEENVIDSATVTTTPSLRSRVLAGLAGGAGALAVTVSLAVAQAGAGGAATGSADAQATDQRTGSVTAAGAVAAPPSASSASTTSPRAVPVDPQAAQRGHRPVTSAAPASELAAGGIPVTALAAYRYGARPQSRTSCRLPWALLAGIGRVESDHGRFAGAVLHTDGVSTPAIVGIPLDGHGTEVVRDTDGGRLDGDPKYDRAVGPMQFIPSTWVTWGRDGNHDGVRDPFNIYDAAAAAADYLCAAGGDLGTAAGQRAAVLAYNHSSAYLAEVIGVEKLYAVQFGVAIPNLPALSVPPTTHHVTVRAQPATGSAAKSGPAGPHPSSSSAPRTGDPSSPSRSSGRPPTHSPTHEPSTSPVCRPTSSHPSSPAPTSSSGSSSGSPGASASPSAGSSTSPSPAPTSTTPSASPTRSCPR